MSKRRLPENNDHEDEPDEKETKVPGCDEFSSFISHPLTSKDIESIKKKDRKGERFELPGLPQAIHTGGCSLSVSPLSVSSSIKDLEWSEKLVNNVERVIQSDCTKEEEKERLRSTLSLVSKYVDISMQMTKKNSNHRVVYCAHILNHIIRTRNLVIGNKKKLESASKNGTASDDLIESLRDQGFVRITAVILAPYRKDAYAIVQTMRQLMFGEDAERAPIQNKARFDTEFGESSFLLPKRVWKDEEEEADEQGNRDDCFKLGVALSKKSLKLYTPFDRSDILICSPLGLRMVIGGDQGNEGHLLSSVQITVVDDADVLLQQNWEHNSLILSTMHQPPAQINTDVSRVRTSYLDGQAVQFSQTLLFSAHRHELFTALSAGRLNHRGLVSFRPSSLSLLPKIELPLCQELHHIKVADGLAQSDVRFAYFKEKMHHTLSHHTAIFIPSYFDYVRIRNFFKKDTESFVQCHEYAIEKKIKRARSMFFNGEKRLMLITERFQYFNRFKIRGIKQIVFYQPPSYPAFYHQMINMCAPEGRLKSTILFSEIDRIRLENIFGMDMARSILSSDKQIQVIVSE